LEQEEFEAVFTFAQILNPDAKMGVFGFSAGAITAIRGASLHPEIQAITAVGNYASLKHEIITPNEPFLTLRWQIERGVYFLYWLKTGLSPAQVNILAELNKISPRPILLIHGEDEQIKNQAVLQLQAAGKNAVLWIAPHSSHGDYLTEVPHDYRKTVINFFEQNLP
jgi:pimeloyl-ACP methyl ester carboxylesterase